jgi:hypothetical protein
MKTGGSRIDAPSATTNGIAQGDGGFQSAANKGHREFEATDQGKVNRSEQKEPRAVEIPEALGRFRRYLGAEWD